MKKIVLIIGVIVFIIALNVTFGQDSGFITYEVKIKRPQLVVRGNTDNQEMPAPPPLKDQLIFNSFESLYVPLIEDEEINHDDGNVRMIIRRPMTEVYCNQNQSKRIVLHELMGKKYRIEDTLNILPWKFGNDIKTILGYTCHQASVYDEEKKQHIVAWYTDKLRPFLGPELFNSLPGAVLAVEINNEERTITAISIDLRELKKNEIKIPSGGTSVTQEEFKKLREEQLQRMRTSGGDWIIRN